MIYDLYDAALDARLGVRIAEIPELEDTLLQMRRGNCDKHDAIASVYTAALGDQIY